MAKPKNPVMAARQAMVRAIEKYEEQVALHATSKVQEIPRIFVDLRDRLEEVESELRTMRSTPFRPGELVAYVNSLEARIEELEKCKTHT
jgi:hypothetical protein